MVAELEKTGYAACRFASREERDEMREEAIIHAKFDLERKGWTHNYRVEDRDEDGDFVLVVWGERD